MSSASAPGCFPLSGLSGLHSSPGVVACAASLVCSGRGTAVIDSSGGEVGGEGLALSQPLLGRSSCSLSHGCGGASMIVYITRMP